MSEASALETLKAARKLIADERDWYQAPANCGWCGEKRVNGRLTRCSGAALASSGAPWPSTNPAWDALRAEMQNDIPTFNDTHTHAEVIAAFDEAIAKLEVPSE